MILWLTVVGAVAVVTAASVWMLGRVRPRSNRESPDPHWGDWPPDQMST